MKLSRRLPILMLGIALLFPTAIFAGEIAAHEASYELVLLETDGAVESDVEGLYLVRIDGTCETNRISTYLDLRLSNLNGAPATVEDTYSITESRAADWLVFSSRQTVNGRVVQHLEGKAIKTQDGGRVEFSAPPDAPPVSLPHRAVFPFEAIEGTMRGLEAGAKSVNQVMFDPTVGDSVRVVDLFIGSAEGLSAPPSGDVALLEGKARRTVTTFYDLEATDAPPMTTAIVDILPNGVSPRAVFDMGPVQVLAELRSIRKLDVPACQ